MATHHRPCRGVVAIGASAGGIDALHRVVETLTDDLEVALCVVLHIPAASPSVLAQIMGRWTPLRVAAAGNEEPLRRSRVYVAPPDRHLLVDGGRLVLDRGPRQNGVRPAVDPLFRSAAASWGRRAAALVLSGALSDGAAGAAAVAAAGGTVIVQDPRDALVASMPEAALEAVPLARLVALHDIGKAIDSFSRGLPPVGEDMEDVTMAPQHIRPSARATARPQGPPSGLTCPECHGPLWEQQDTGIVKFRCRGGHTYYEDSLIEEKDHEVEAAMWSAVEALEEHSELTRQVAARMAHADRADAARLLHLRAAGADGRAARRRAVIGVETGEEPDAA